MFFVPGMGHCGGGFATDKFDPLSAIVAWVEEDAAPDYLAAQGDHFPGAKRPVCAWPKVARYQGGPADVLGSFVCE
jgi:feruloyl esterase